MSGSGTYSTIYSFGDSLSDAGDAYLLTSSTEAGLLGMSPEPASPPYYQETYGAITADVFGNGPVWVQDLAKDLGIAATPAPGQLGVSADALLAALKAQGGFVALEAQGIVNNLEQQQGVSGQNNPYLKIVDGAVGGTDFAIGGSVTGPTDANTDITVGLSDLSAQLANFQAEVQTPVANALYTVWSGSNDLLALIGNTDAATAVAQSVANEVAMVKSLVAIGAQTVLVVNVPDLGKIPEIIGQGNATLDATMSALSLSFDQQLAAGLAGIDFGTSRLVQEDSYGLIDAAVADPATYGLTNVTGSVYDGAFTGGGGLVSSDPAVQDQYLFFDQLHPTETGQSVIASGALTALTAACFLAGTRIATPRGEAAIETLRPGDPVLTADGAARPAIWVGRAPFDAARHPEPYRVWPVRIRAGALGDGLPCRDLLVSPGHSLLIDGVLLQAERLINGATIIRDAGVSRGVYFHVELESHDILLSEGVASESYLDTGNRTAFVNGGAVATLHPDFASRAGGATCRPLHEDGPVLAAAVQRLTERAEALGWRRDDGLSPQLLIDGVAREPVGRVGGRVVFAIPRGAHRLRLRSGGGVPALSLRDSQDLRRLGVSIDGLTVIRAGRRRDLALDDPALTDGWHAVERDGGYAWRWTNGDAGLALSGPCRLEIAVAGGLPVWTAPRCEAGGLAETPADLWGAMSGSVLVLPGMDMTKGTEETWKAESAR